MLAAWGRGKEPTSYDLCISKERGKKKTVDKMIDKQQNIGIKLTKLQGNG